MEAQTTNDTLYYIWFAVLIFLLVVFFIAKLKFNKIFERRAERRRMLSYSKVKLSPNEEGRSRILKIKRIT
jgi:Na+/H+ antiporter NhaC